MDRCRNADDEPVTGSVMFRPLTGMPEIGAGDDLAAILIDCLSHGIGPPGDMDILVVAQKVVSKAEGRLVDLATVSPSAEALQLARTTGKDPRIVELILGESRSVIRSREGLLITEHHLGFVMANAGIDQSNIGSGHTDKALLLPRDPDQSARGLRARIERHFGRQVGVVVSDSTGRPWRLGSTGMALGSAGIPPLLDYRGRHDRCGRRMEVTEVAWIDQIAAGAALVMGEGGEGFPAAHVRGLRWTAQSRTASALIRPADQDLFRS